MLKVVSSEEAFEIINNNLDLYECNSERVSLYDSLGRVLSEDIISGESIPPFNRSTVDGYAVRSSDTYGCGESMPAQLDIIGEILMGENADKPIKDGQCIKISTGGMLPAGADSVVMVEHTDCSFDSLCLAYKAVSPFENVTRKGDDIKVGDTVLRKGTVITSREIGILASLGVSEVSACIKPRVGIISTGDEIVPIDGEASPGKIRDINSHILSAGILVRAELHGQLRALPGQLAIGLQLLDRGAISTAAAGGQKQAEQDRRHCDQRCFSERRCFFHCHILLFIT